MKDSALSQDAFPKLILENLVSNESGLNRFNDLLQQAKLEKTLLQISSYKSAEFILKTENLKRISGPQIDRLTLIYPPSFEFSMDYQVSGHFNVKYNTASNTLPILVKPFIVTYSGIIIPKGDHFELKNEKIRIKGI